MKNIFEGWFKNLAIGQNIIYAHHNSQTNRACFARILQRLDHGP